MLFQLKELKTRYNFERLGNLRGTAQRLKYLEVRDLKINFAFEIQIFSSIRSRNFETRKAIYST
jgi:hypothetical protein